jgi:hypothetical protein
VTTPVPLPPKALRTLNRYRKTIVALLAVPAELLSLGLLHGEAQAWTQAAIPVVTALGVALARYVPLTSIYDPKNATSRGKHEAQ